MVGGVSLWRSRALIITLLFLRRYPLFQILLEVHDAGGGPVAVHVFFQLHLPGEVFGEIFVVEFHVGHGDAVFFFDLENVGEGEGGGAGVGGEGLYGFIEEGFFCRGFFLEFDFRLADEFFHHFAFDALHQFRGEAMLRFFVGVEFGEHVV